MLVSSLSILVRVCAFRFVLCIVIFSCENDFFLDTSLLLKKKRIGRIYFSTELEQALYICNRIVII